MLTDAILVCVHLSAMLALVVFFTAATGVLRCGTVDAAGLARLARMQLWVWASLWAVALSGAALLAWGAKGAPWLLHNPLLWSKVALWAVMAVMAIPFSRRLARWRRDAVASAWQLDASEKKWAVRWLMIQSHIMVVPPLLGVLVARGFG